MKNHWDDLKDNVLSTWDISYEEFLNTHGDFDKLIKLVMTKNNKNYNETRDILNLMLNRRYKQ